MAGFTDLRGKNQERAVQQYMMLRQLQNRGTSSGESNLDRVLREQAEEERKAEEERRLREESEARKGNIQSEITTRERARAMADWETTEKDRRGWAKSEREERELTEGTLPLKKAQKGEAEARTGLIGTQRKVAEQDLQAKKDWLKNQHDAAFDKHTNDTWNMGVQNIISGNPSALTKDNADNLERAGRLKFGPGFTLPRKEDGSLDPSAVPHLAATVTDKNGQPTADFMKDLKAAEKPDTHFEAYVRSWQDAINRGKPEEAKWYSDKLWTEVAPTVGKVQGALLKQMFDDGDVDGIKQTLPGFRPSASRAKAAGLPPAAARQQTEDGVNTLGQIDRLNEQFSSLVNTLPMPPTGRLVMPMYDFWAAIQHSNPDVQAFRANLKDVVAQYRKFITGKASNEKEMADLLQAVPNENDDVKAFTKKLAEMRWKTTRRIRTDLGMQQAYGLQVPVELSDNPDFAPISPTEAIKKWGSPDLNTDSGQRLWHAGELERGQAVVGDRLRRSGQQIGGTTEFRNKGGQLGQSIDPQSLQDFYNGLSPKMQSVFEQMSPDDQVRAMQGTLK